MHGKEMACRTRLIIEPQMQIFKYRTRSWLQTALEHTQNTRTELKKKLFENKKMDFKYGVINIQAAGYKGASMVITAEACLSAIHCKYL